MSLIISNKLEKLIAALEENKDLTTNLEDYRTRLEAAKNELSSFSGATATTFRDRYEYFMNNENGVFPKLEKQLEDYNTNMDDVEKKTSVIIDRCNHFADTLYVDGYTAEYIEGKERGWHILFDDYVESIKQHCDWCLDVDEQQLEHVKDAEGLMTNDVKEVLAEIGLANPLEGASDAMSGCKTKQDAIENFRESFNTYALDSGDLNDHAKTIFDEITDPDVAAKYPYPEGMGDSDEIRETLRNRYEALTVYILAEDGSEKLQQAMDDFENNKEVIVQVYSICSTYIDNSYDPEAAKPYTNAMDIMMTGLLTRETYCPENSGCTLYYDYYDEEKVAYLMDNVGTGSIAFTFLFKFANSSYFTNSNYISDPKSVTTIRTELDKAGVNFTVVNTTDNWIGSDDVKETNLSYYTSKERGGDYLNIMLDSDPTYADHLMNDLGYTEDELAGMFAAAECTEDMTLLDALVNADDDYNNLFAISPEGTSASCQIVLSDFAIDLFVDDNIPELETFTNSMLNATDGVDAIYNTEEYLKWFSVGIGVQNEFDIENYKAHTGDPAFRSRLEASNTLFSLYSTLYGIYENGGSYIDENGNDVELPRLCETDTNISMAGGDLNMAFHFVPYDCGDYFSNQKVIFSLDINITNPANNDDRNIALKDWEVGVSSSVDAFEQIMKDSLNEIHDAIEQRKAEAQLDAAITAISIFQPEIGAALKLSTDIINGDEGFDMLYTGTQNAVDLGSAMNDGLEDGISVPGGVSTAYSLGTTIADYVTTMQEISEDEADEFKKYHDYLSVHLFNSYINGVDELTVRDPDVIDKMDEWDEKGCTYVYDAVDETHTNDAVANNLYDTDEVTKATSLKGSVSATIENVTNNKYSDEEMKAAMDVIVYGGDNVQPNDYYNSIHDIPYDLANACLIAIDVTGVSGESLYTGWNNLIN